MKAKLLNVLLELFDANLLKPRYSIYPLETHFLISSSLIANWLDISGYQPIEILFLNLSY